MQVWAGVLLFSDNCIIIEPSSFLWDVAEWMGIAFLPFSLSNPEMGNLAPSCVSLKAWSIAVSIANGRCIQIPGGHLMPLFGRGQVPGWLCYFTAPFPVVQSNSVTLDWNTECECYRVVTVQSKPFVQSKPDQLHSKALTGGWKSPILQKGVTSISHILWNIGGYDNFKIYTQLAIVLSLQCPLVVAISSLNQPFH